MRRKNENGMSGTEIEGELTTTMRKRQELQNEIFSRIQSNKNRKDKIKTGIDNCATREDEKVMGIISA